MELRAQSKSSAEHNWLAACATSRFMESPHFLLKCIGTMNPPAAPPRRGAERRGQVPSREGSGPEVGFRSVNSLVDTCGMIEGQLLLSRRLTS